LRQKFKLPSFSNFMIAPVEAARRRHLAALWRREFQCCHARTLAKISHFAFQLPLTIM
jgi:hypothetical protein